MVALYVDGQRVGTLAEVADTLPTFLGSDKAVELRDDASGRKLATVTPEPICPWEPTLTKEEIDRRVARGVGKPLAEILERLGAE